MRSQNSITRLIRILISGLLTFACGTALGQDPSDLSLAFVKPYTAEFDYFVDAQGLSNEKAGSWTDSVTIDDGLLSRTVKRYTAEGVVDLSRAVIVDQETLAPVRIQQRFGSQLTNVYQLEFKEQTLTQILIGDAGSPAQVSSAELAEPGVEVGLQAVFVLSLPMERPQEVTVNTYVAGAEPKTVAKTFHIVGQEQVEAMGQTLDAWRIEDRATQWTYWVRQNKPYIVRVTHPLPGGKMATSLVTKFD